MKNNRTIKGKVLDLKGNVVPKVKVEAWDKDLLIDDLLGTAITTANGNFTLSFNEKYYKELIFDRKPDLYFKVFLNEECILVSDEVIWNADKDEKIVLRLDRVFGSGDNGNNNGGDGNGSDAHDYEANITVDGTISTRAKYLPEGIRVQVVNKLITKEDVLATTRPNEKGGYKFKIAFSSSEKPAIQTQVLNKSGEVIGVSAIVYELNNKITLNIGIVESPKEELSEYEQITLRIKPLIGTLSAGELSNEQQNLLAEKTGIELPDISRYSDAQRFSEAEEISAEILYAWFYNGVSVDADAIYAHSDAALRSYVSLAVRDAIIPTQSDVDVSNALEKMKRSALVSALDAPVIAGGDSYKTILETASVKAKSIESFLDISKQYDGNNANTFWEDLQTSDNGITAAEVKKIKFSVQAGSLALGNAALTQKFVNLKKDKVISELIDLADWSADQWDEFISDSTDLIPANVPGENLNERKQNYIKASNRIIEQTYPTRFLSARMLEGDFGVSRDFNRFVKANPDFEIGETNISEYIAKNQGSLRGIKDQEGFVNSLKQLQVRYMLSPGFERHESISRLDQMNVRSSHDIAGMGWKAFSTKYVSAGGSEQMAGIVYEMAGHNSAMMQHVQMTYSNDMILGTYVTEIPNYWAWISERFTDGEPDLETLFGSQDFCECLHCRSIYSPSAYLVDVLQFLKKAELSTGVFDNAQEVLFDRRPDICNIDLNCDNTNRAMPYIDLINEIFENAVYKVSTGDTPDYSQYQTTLTAEELLAHPEHIRPEVYDDTLKNAHYPWSLPFDLWTEEGRTYLGHLNLPRYRVMDHWFVGGNHLTDNDIAAEVLRLSEIDREILIGTTSATNKELWGLTAAGNLVDLLDEPKKILEQSGMEYKTLVALLRTWFINPEGDINIRFDASDACNLQKASLTNLTEDALMKMLRFTRVAMKLNWSVRDLDIALRGLGATTFDNDTLLRLSHIVRLNNRIKVTSYQMGVLWGNLYTGHVMDADDERSPYEQLFLNKAIVNPVDETFVLNEDLTELDDTTKDIVDHDTTIKAGIGITDAELTLLVDEILPDGKINLSNLSALYRHIVLADEMKISVEELLQLINLSGVNPFDVAATEATIQFIDEYEELKSVRLTVPYIKYLLSRQTSLYEGVGMSESDVSSALTSIQAELKRIVDENQFSPDPLGEETTAKLATLLAAAELNTSVEIIEQTTALSEADQLVFLNANWTDFLSNVADAENKLIRTAHPDFIAGNQARYEYLLTDLLTYSIRTGTRELLKQLVATELGLDADVTEELLYTWLFGPDDSTKLVGEVLRDDAFMSSANPTITKADFPDQFNSFVLLHKSSIILNNFRVTSTELPYLFENAFDPGIAGWAGWFNFNGIPVIADGSPNDLFAQLIRMRRLFDFYHKLPASDVDFFALMLDAYDPSSATTLTEIHESIADLTNWELENINELSGVRFSFTKNDFKDELPFVALAKCINVIKLTGASASNIASWTALELTSDISAQIVHSVKSLYSLEQWHGIARPLRDVLREQQRSALVAWLLANQSAMRSEFDLYAYYLVDPEMSACMLTSRMRLAMSSVQLFVQRCQMNLEANVRIDDADQSHWDQWKWMKTYRLWEVNRKIFTYPENWMEPALRDDKTEIFKELEQELSQVQVNDGTMEVAYINYLKKLEDVSNMEILGVCQADANNASLGAYVFGKTIGTPQILYYRKYTQDHKWTSWKKIEIDFEGEHLIPIMYNGRLHIFWPIFTSVTQQIAAPSGEDDRQQPQKYYEIQMAWTSLRNGMWEPKRMTKEKISEFGHNRLFDAGSTNERQHREGPGRFFVGKRIDNNNNLILNIFASTNERRSVQSVRFSMSQVGGFLFNSSMKATLIEMTEEEREVNAMWRVDAYNQGYNEPVRFPPYTRDFRIYGRTILQTTPPDRYTIKIKDRNIIPIFWDTPFFYQDSQNTFAITRDPSFGDQIYDIQLHTHPYASDFLKVVNEKGVAGLLDPDFSSNPDRLEYKLRRQQVEETFFEETYGARTPAVKENIPVNKIDFDLGAAYSIYNWEVFYHIPMMVAEKLSTNQKFAEAQKWYHYIFDPTDTSTEYSVPQRFWKLKPFVEIYDEAADGTPASIEELMLLLNAGDSEMRDQVDAWRADPFNPHLIGRMRITALQKNVVMKYIDNLLSWADMLFRQDTMETTNEATQLYMLAWFILGDRPELVAGRDREDKSYCELSENGIDDFSNALVTLETKLVRYYGNKYSTGFDKFKEYMITPNKNFGSEKFYAKDQLWFEEVQLETFEAIENFDMEQPDIPNSPMMARRMKSNKSNESAASLPMATSNMNFETDQTVVWAGSSNFTNAGSQMYWNDNLHGSIMNLHPSINWVDDIVYIEPWFRYETQVIQGLYFCIPHNDYLLNYWNKVEDRMYKLRNCLNIDGVFRQLPLFDPPIDPAAIVRANASGADLSSVLNALTASMPNYRFEYTVEKAKEFTEVVERFGKCLLEILERRDEEALELLRSKGYLELMESVRKVRELEIDQIQKHRNALSENKGMLERREEYFDNKEEFNVAEGFQVGLYATGMAVKTAAKIVALTSSVIYQIPQYTAGFAGWAGTPVVLASIGGMQVAKGVEKIADVMGTASEVIYKAAYLSGVIAKIQRKKKEAEYKAKTAADELKIIEKRIEEAEKGYEIATENLNNHDQKIDQAQAEYDFHRGKFTNKELYDWMTSQISAVYFQAYNMAFDMAKRAEANYNFELPESNDTFISFGYWDSLKKGLLSGEKLRADLMRMEASYLEKNKRTYELTKHVSLELLDPYALAQVKGNGSCFIDIPEELFDIDHPGHYLRRIKSVSVTIQSAVGPNGNVNSKLTLLSSQIRKNTDADPADATSYPRKTDGSETRFIENLTMIESIATSAAESDDGLFVLDFQDDRYLPFEGAGVISNWALELPGEFRTFDYNTITDVIITINYTAKDGGSVLRSLAEQHLVSFVEEDPDTNLEQLFSLRNDFSVNWDELFNPAPATPDQSTILSIDKSNFPYLFNNREIGVKTMDAVLILENPTDYDNANKVSLYLNPDSTGEVAAPLTANTTPSSPDYIGGNPVNLAIPVVFDIDENLVSLELSMKNADLSSVPAELTEVDGAFTRLKEEAVKDILLVCSYNAEEI